MISPRRISACACLALLIFVSGCDRVGSSTDVDAAHNHDHDHDGHAHHDAHDDHDVHEQDAHVHADEVTLSEQAIARHGVKIDAARKMKLSPTTVAPGRVSFNTEAMAHVGSAVAGRIAELRVRVGDVVARGDVLLVIESPELGEAQSDFLQKRIAAQTALPGAELARSAYERVQGIYDDQRGVTLTEVQKRQAEHHAAQVTLLTAQTAATAAENRLHALGMNQAAIDELARTTEIHPHFNITAPIAGTVVERDVTLGELVGRDRESLLILADMRTLWVLADVPEQRLRHVVIGSTARITAAGFEAETCTGTVSFISPSIDPATRSAAVRIEVDNGHATLRPGIFVQVEISGSSAVQGDQSNAVIAVPETAVQTVEGGPAVFVIVEGEPNTFAKRSISVGRAVGGMVPVQSGLSEGESYVSAGSFILKAELGKDSAAHSH